MQGKKVDFASRKFRSLLFSATLAIAIEYLVLLSDNIIVGNMLGESGIAGMNVITPFLALSAFLSILISAGTAILMSRAMGSFNQRKANEYFGMGVIGAVISGVLMLLIILIGGFFYIDYMELSPEIQAYAKGYYYGIILLGLVQPFYSTLYELVYNDGDSSLCSISSLVQVITNVGLSVSLCKLIGIKGVSTATVVSVIFAGLVLLVHFWKKKNTLHFVWYFQWKEFWNVCKLSLTDASLYFYFSAFLMIMNKFMVVHFGEQILPVFSIAFNLTEATIIFDGIGEAMQPLISVYFAEQNTKGIKNTMNVATITAVIEGIVALAVFQIFADRIPLLFGMTDPVIVSEGAKAIHIVSFMLPCYSFIYLFSSYYLDIDKIKLAVSIPMIANLVMDTVCAIVFGLLFGLNGVWAGMAVCTTCSVLLCGAIVWKQHGKYSFPLLLDKEKDAAIYSYSIQASRESIMNLVSKAEQILKKQNVEASIRVQVMLLIEELGMLIVEKNEGKKILLECTLDLNDGISLILRDDGVMFDITDADMQVGSLRSFVASCVMSKQDYRRHLITTGYNRNAFKLV